MIGCRSGHSGGTRRWISLVVAAGLFSRIGAQADAREIWFATLARASEGYVQVLQQQAAWNDVAHRIDVLQVHVSLINRVNDQRLKLMVDWLARNNVKLAVVSPILPPEQNCARKEAQINGTTLAQAVARVRSAGGKFDYLAFDEPVWFGGMAPEPRSCATSGTDLAQAAAAAIGLVRGVYPNVIVGDIEPDRTSLPLMADFLAGLRRSGTPVSFVHLDVDWDRDWTPSLARWGSWLQQRAITRGVIFDGGAWGTDNAVWEATALARFDTARTGILTHADQLVFESWKRAPGRYLPEEEPGTMTHFVKQALSRPISP